MPWTRLPPASTTIAWRPIATGEMADLVRSFNHMAADLEASRQLAESSSAQLTAANQAIEERRRELETIVETIPSRRGHAGRRGRRAAGESRLCRADGPARGCRTCAERRSKRCCRAECADDLAGVIRRGQRMGAASTEIEFHARGRTMHLAITSARLELAHGQTGHRAGGRRHHRAAARAAAVGVEGSGAARGARDQESAHAHRAFRRADRPASRPRPAGFAQRHPQVQRGDSGLRGHAAHAGGSVLRAGAVSRAAAARLRHEPGGRRGAGAVCRPAGGHHGAARSGAGSARGAGRSRGHPPRAGQPHRQCRRGHAGQPAARARHSQLRSAKMARRSRSPSPTPATD